MDASQQNPSPTLHRAAWLISGGSKAIADGAVLVADGMVVDCGAYNDLKRFCPASATRIDHGDAAIVPALVNGHTHLELTGLQGKISLPQAGFRTWLETLFRHQPSLDAATQQQGLRTGRKLLLDAGTALCGDITNGNCLAARTESPLPQRHAFLEVLGFDREELAAALPAQVLENFLRGSSPNPSQSLAAHACYSTSAVLIQQTKAWCRQHEAVFAIHTAEHPEEIEFLNRGTGYCRQILEALGRDIGGWSPPKMTPVEYLEALGVLDSQTLLVHAVHLTERDWQTVAAKGCSVCFCPRSNYNLNVGQADIGRALQLGVTAALGTDSLASNTDLDLFSEAVFVLNRFPSLSPAAVFRMMTEGGAQSLALNGRFGSVAPGRAAALLAIPLPDGIGSRPAQLFETIIHQGAKGAWQWVTHPTSN